MKYRYSRKELINKIWDGVDIYDFVKDDLLATKEPEKCDHTNDKGIEFCKECQKWIVEKGLGLKIEGDTCLVCHSDMRGMSFCPECLTQKGKENKVGFEFEDLLDEVERSTKDGTNPTLRKPKKINRLSVFCSEAVIQGKTIVGFDKMEEIEKLVKKTNDIIDQVNKLSEKN